MLVSTSSLARRVLCRQARPSCLSSTALIPLSAAHHPHRIAHPASTPGVRWRPQPTARTLAIAIAIALPPLVDRHPIRISRSRQSARTAPHAASTADQRPAPAPAAGSANEHWAPFTHHYLTLPPFHPSSPFIIARARTGLFKSTLPRTHLPSFINPTLRTHHHSSSPVRQQVRCTSLLSTRRVTAHPSLVSASARCTHARTCCALLPAPSCARLTLAAPPRLPSCVARASPSRQ